MIEYELSQNPDVLVLDREDLSTDDRRKVPGRPAGRPEDLDDAADLRRTADGRERRPGRHFRALTPLGNGKGPTGTLSGSSRDVAALGRDIAAGVSRNLSLQAPAARPPSSAARRTRSR